MNLAQKIYVFFTFKACTEWTTRTKYSLILNLMISQVHKYTRACGALAILKSCLLSDETVF